MDNSNNVRNWKSLFQLVSKWRIHVNAPLERDVQWGLKKQCLLKVFLCRITFNFLYYIWNLPSDFLGILNDVGPIYLQLFIHSRIIALLWINCRGLSICDNAVPPRLTCSNGKLQIFVAFRSKVWLWQWSLGKFKNSLSSQWGLGLGDILWDPAL